MDLGFWRGRPLPEEHPAPEDLAEGGAEHSVHAAVKYEVDRSVQQGQHVHHVAEVLVTLQEEAFPPHADEEPEYSLGKLGEEEQQQDGDQHLGGSVGPSFRLGLLLRAIVVEFGRASVVGTQDLFAYFGFVQSPYQPYADHGQDAAGY